MTTPRDNPVSRRTRANGDGTVYQRKDSRWEAAGYVLAPGNTRRRVRVYGTTRKDALAKLTEKIAASNRGVPVPSAAGSVAAYLTYWLENVALHHLRETTHTRYTTCVSRYLIPGLGKKKLAKLTAKDVRTWLNQLRTTCQCCTRGIDARRDQPRCCAIGRCCSNCSPADAHLHPLRTQVRPGARRPRGRDPAQRSPQRPHRHPTPPTLRTPHRRRSPAVPRRRPGPPAARAVRTRPPHWAPQGRTPRPALGRPRPRRGHRRNPPHPSAHQHRRAHHATHQNPGLRTPHRPPHPLRPVPEAPPRTAAARTCDRRHVVAAQRARVHHSAGSTDRPDKPHPHLHRAPPKGLRRIRFHDLRHSTATLLLEQGVELVVIKELLGHAHIGVTATVYAHVRLRLQRDAIDTLSTALDSPENTKTARSDGDEPPPCAALVR